MKIFFWNWGPNLMPFRRGFVPVSTRFHNTRFVWIVERSSPSHYGGIRRRAFRQWDVWRYVDFGTIRVDETNRDYRRINRRVSSPTSRANVKCVWRVGPGRRSLYARWCVAPGLPAPSLSDGPTANLTDRRSNHEWSRRKRQTKNGYQNIRNERRGKRGDATRTACTLSHTRGGFIICSFLLWIFNVTENYCSVVFLLSRALPDTSKKSTPIS